MSSPETPVKCAQSVAPGLNDPLLAKVPLPCSGTFFPHGFPVVISSNASEVLVIAENAWGDTRPARNEPPIHVRCIVSDGPAVAEPSHSICRAQWNLLTNIVDGNNFFSCDVESQRGCIWVTKPVVENVSYFRYHFLEAVVFSLMEIAHLMTLHAACVERDGKGILLAGESGAGKSSLSYACARRGWTYVSDDASALIRRGDQRTVLGTPRRFRFRASAGSLFPEFEGWKESDGAQGKPTIEVSTELLPSIKTAPSAVVHSVVFLDRTHHGQNARLIPVRPEEAVQRLLMTAWPPELAAATERYLAVQNLVQNNNFELRYQTLDEAIGLLETLI